MTLSKLSPLIIITFFVVVFSCKKDKELIQADFIGTYSVSETCDNDNDNYDLIISSVGTNENSLQIYNLWDWAEYATATIDGAKISIPSQVLDGIVFEGTGSLSDNTLTINYSIVDGSDNEICKAICQKK